MMKIPKFFRENNISSIVFLSRHPGNTRMNENAIIVDFKNPQDVRFFDIDKYNYRYMGGYSRGTKYGSFNSRLPAPTYTIEPRGGVGGSSELIVYSDLIFLCPATLGLWKDWDLDDPMPRRVHQAAWNEDVVEIFMCVRDLIKADRKEFGIKECKWADLHGLDFCRLQQEHDEAERLKKQPVVKLTPKPIKVESNPVTAHHRKPNYVYLMKNIRNGYYKIGRSIDPKVREKTLQAEDPDIKMVFKVQAPKRLEKTLHQEYQEKRLRGEWFALTRFDVQKITRMVNSTHGCRKITV